LQEEKLIAIDLDIPFVYKLRNELAKHEIEVSNCNSEEMLVNELCQ
jgi:hypothetical protein